MSFSKKFIARRSMESKLSIKDKACVQYNPDGSSYVFTLKHRKRKS